MPQYMLQFSYNAEAMAALSKSPVDRTESVAALAKKMGGKLVSLMYTMGEFDGVAIIEAPDDVAGMATIIAASAPGHLKRTQTTRLYTSAEFVAALKKAQGAGFTAPKG
jgi:uncharacterized protein with GYD domain